MAKTTPLESDFFFDISWLCLDKTVSTALNPDGIALLQINQDSPYCRLYRQIEAFALR